MRIFFACLFLAATCFRAAGQPASAADSAVNRLLEAASGFQYREALHDSALHHPLGSHSREDYYRRNVFYDSLYKAAQAITADGLSIQGQINLALLRYETEDQLAEWKYQSYLNPILSDEGFHTYLASLGSQVLVSRRDYARYLDKLADIPRAVKEYLDLMREGLRLGISQPRAILNGYYATYKRHIVDTIERSVFWQPFMNRPVAIPDSVWQRLQAEGRRAIRESVIPAYRAIRDFFDTEYLPGTRTTIGVSHFPNGNDYYRDRVRHYTTTSLDPDEIFEAGLKEVARIDSAMKEVLRTVHFKGDVKAFIAWLRKDARFYATSGEQLLKEASFIAKRVDGLLPRFFGKLPRQPYGVEPVPDHLAPTYTAGRYAGAPLGSRRAGNYWVNTYDLKSRPLYALESLTLHEAVPGHHLQIALAKELDLPAFRRNLYVNAFGEGWGLYAEWLGTEMGFYKDPYSLFGRLTYDMWRACRLVLDVGLHTKNWTREQAVAYLADHTALSLHEVNTEVNRYISWPGQALSYKIGEWKIRELRLRAEKQLREKFDLREFHDLVLSEGTVTLTILEQMVDRYISEKLKGVGF